MGEGKDTIVRLSTWDVECLGTVFPVSRLYKRNRTHKGDAVERAKVLVSLECELLRVPVERSGLFWWIFAGN